MQLILLQSIALFFAKGTLFLKISEPNQYVHELNHANTISIKCSEQ